MDYFKNFTKQDLLDIQTMDTKQYNDFIKKHHYAKCSACGREYLYFESPRLKKDKWEKVKEFFHLTENHEMKSVQGYKTGSDSAKLFRINNILKTYNDSCLVCPECMEKALGHILTIDDLENIGISQSYIKNHNINK